MKKYFQEKIFKSPIYPAQIVFIKTNDETKLKNTHNIEFSQHEKVKAISNAFGLNSEAIKELTTTMFEIKQNARKSNKKESKQTRNM